jgi:hypothetical protein
MVYRCLVLPLFFLAASANVVNGFRVDGNQDLMRAVEDALQLNTVKQPPKAKDDAPPLRNEILKTEVPCMYEYWSRPDIHTLGNMGFMGAIHAAMAPFATKVSSIQIYEASFTLLWLYSPLTKVTPTSLSSIQRR